MGSVAKGSMDLGERMKAEPLPKEFEPKEMVDAVPLLRTDTAGEEKGTSREIVLGRNVHTMCLEVKEPEDDDEVTGDREAYMASVLARYRRSLIDRSKHHLGTITVFY